ncbi:hypothetical protein AB1N83_010558 [Pleurotus pulmonarius]
MMMPTSPRVLAIPNPRISPNFANGCINNSPFPALLEELRIKFKYDREEYPWLPEYERLSDFLFGLRSRGALKNLSVAIHFTLRDDGDETEVRDARADGETKKLESGFTSIIGPYSSWFGARHLFSPQAQGQKLVLNKVNVIRRRPYSHSSLPSASSS